MKHFENLTNTLWMRYDRQFYHAKGLEVGIIYYFVESQSKSTDIKAKLKE